MSSRVFLAGLFLFAALATTAAQNPSASSPGDADAALRERITRYWQARTDMNLVAAYPFYEPEFRAAYSLEHFLSNFQRLLRFKPQFLGIARISIGSNGREALVGVRLRIKPNELNGEELDIPSEEIWLWIDGDWYRQREALLPSI